MRSCGLANSCTRPCCARFSIASRTSPRASCSTASFNRRVFLADDLIKLRRVHSGQLQLLKRLSGFNPLVLVRIADEDHAVSVIQPHKELVHLFGARETRFIHEVKTTSIVGLLSAGQVMLQGMRGDARFFELLRCAGSWG